MKPFHTDHIANLEAVTLILQDSFPRFRDDFDDYCQGIAEKIVATVLELPQEEHPEQR